MRVAINVAAFYVAWFVAIMAAARGYAWPGVATCSIGVVLHLALNGPVRSEMLLLGAVTLAGVIVESVLMAFGFAQYAAPGPFPALPPFWLISIWTAFGTLFNVSLAWIQSRLGLAALLGFVAAPLSYCAGEHLGGMTIGAPQAVGLLVIGCVWAVVFPALLYLARCAR